MSRRVVITGVGLLSPLGNTFEDFIINLYKGKSGIESDTDWVPFGLETHLRGSVKDFSEKNIPRKERRSMSRVAQLAVTATKMAFDDASLSKELIENERTGISYGSTMGGTSAIQDFFGSTVDGNVTKGVMSTTFLKIMSHTCAANIGTAFKIPGPTMASCTACAASTQGIGFGYQAIKEGRLDVAVCGGAEELHVSVASVFDTLRSTSTKYNDKPHLSPRPFDENRDGTVISEGAGTIILEDMENAINRGAIIYGEVVGYYTNNDGVHMTNPSETGLNNCMKGALRDADLTPSDIDYINAHGTATLIGDIAESKAIENIFGNNTPVSSLKGNIGHTMGACGVLETAGCIAMLRDQKLVPTLNLENPDPDCGDLDYVKGECREHKIKHILKNSFAFGGINASLVISRF
ncbi:MAG: beta-ketoacyl-[acyl-carrier-protein] synthase family protein [Desulfobacterales bacterium]|nr:beta-ketoacyl-[acyl-carrier-protein] synthase family protein [Desulfobacterales bacterium]MCP4160425.1 beta-ketoacyl-[acyl-carrier-protein] synthase family protein [Deltaproteobacteria bacterium]